ncbi:hypothetical protein H0H93_006349 [Arthromyces matolae]|nr:hypothetical protein H0H93_006349 [Arthromyces matolae]
MRRPTPGTVLTAIIICLLAFSQASPIPWEQLIPREDLPSFAVSTHLFIRDDSTIATRANEGESSMTQDSLQHDRTKRVSSTHELPSPKRAKNDLLSLRPQPPQPPGPQPKKSAASVELGVPDLKPRPAQLRPQADVADVESTKAGIPPDLTGEQVDVVLQVLDSNTADDRLPWNTREPYKWSSQTKKNVISFYRLGLRSEPNDENTLNKKIKDFWQLTLQERAKESAKRIGSARQELIKGHMPRNRCSLLFKAIEEGNEPWTAASNWEAAERQEKWNDDWIWTQDNLKEVLACLTKQLGRKARPEVLEDITFEEFKRRIQPDWKRVKDNGKAKSAGADEKNLKRVGLAGLIHKDSTGNTEVLKRGDLQMTSAGTDISHSKNNTAPTESTSSKSGRFLAPLNNKWAKIVAPVEAQAEGVNDTREG